MVTPSLKRLEAELGESEDVKPSPNGQHLNDEESALGESCVNDKEIARLASLSPLEYERQRQAAAKQIGCRASILDKLVETARPKQTADNLQGVAVDFADVEMWPTPVNGVEVLDAVKAAFQNYVVLPDGAPEMLTLWTAHSHVFTAFLCTPRLNISSPEKGCGKTTLLDVLTLLVPKPIKTENLTCAVLFRLIEAHKPVVLADEYDAWMRDNEELRGLLNAGHRRGAKVYRCEGDSNAVRGFDAFAPVVLAGIGSLPDTLHDRSLVVRLERAKPGEVTARFDSRQTGHEVELCQKLARWTHDNAARIRASDPQLPARAVNRIADNWRPLFAIAETVGGDWPKHASAAFEKLTAKADTDAEGIGTLLLSDIRAIIHEKSKKHEITRISSSELANALAEMEHRPWPEFSKGKPITNTKLSRQLKRFNVISQTVREDDETFKGYYVEDFQNAFARYCPPFQSVTPSQPA